jgi:hypothetical protein
MPGHECYHCKNWVEEGEAHDCWTTTEAALTRELPEDLQEAWERLRETAAGFGEQRIYASHKAIMFSRKACYFFVRPKQKMLEVVFFLGRAVKAPQIRSARQTSQTKIAHTVHVKHRDEVEAPITDWLQQAYETSDALTARQRERRTTNGERRTENAERRTKNPERRTKNQEPKPRSKSVRKAAKTGAGKTAAKRKRARRGLAILFALAASMTTTAAQPMAPPPDTRIDAETLQQLAHVRGPRRVDFDRVIALLEQRIKSGG